MLSRKSLGKLLSAGSVDFLSALGIFLLASVVARHLGEEAFNIYGLIRRTGGLVLSLSIGGASIALTRELARHPGPGSLSRLARWAAAQALAVGALFALLLLVGGERLRTILLGASTGEVLLYGLAFPAALGLASLGFAAYRGRDRIGAASLFSGFSIALPLYLAFALVMTGYGLRAVFAALVVGGALPFLAVLAFGGWRGGASGEATKLSRREFYMVSLTRSAAPALVNVFFASSLWLAGGRYGSEMLAAFLAAFTVYRMAEAGLRFIGIPVLPWFAKRAEGLGNLIRFRRQVLMLVLIPLAAGGVAAGLLFRLGGPFLSVFFKIPETVGGPLMAVLVLSMPFYSLYVVTRPLLDAIDARPMALVSMIAGTGLTLLLHGLLMITDLPPIYLAVNVACGAMLMGLVNLGFIFRSLPRLRFLVTAPLTLVLSFLAGWGLAALLSGMLT